MRKEIGGRRKEAGKTGKWQERDQRDVWFYEMDKKKKKGERRREKGRKKEAGREKM
jgi:hypothetical protein